MSRFLRTALFRMDWRMSRRTLIGLVAVISIGLWTRAEAEETKAAKTTFLSEAKKYLGTSGRPNVFTQWYAKRHGSAFANAAWCAMYLSFVAASVGMGTRIGEFAYTPYWVNWFKRTKKWGTVPRVGAIVFYDWGHDGVVDHVGVVEAVSKDRKRFYAIEGNKADSVQRVLRDLTYVAGFGYPTYPLDPKPTPKPKPPAVKTHTVVVGDTLTGISRKYYGTDSKWSVIWHANEKTIGGNPSLIKPGQKLIIP